MNIFFDKSLKIKTIEPFERINLKFFFSIFTTFIKTIDIKWLLNYEQFVAKMKTSCAK